MKTGDLVVYNYNNRMYSIADISEGKIGFNYYFSGGLIYVDPSEVVLVNDTSIIDILDNRLENDLLDHSDIRYSKFFEEEYICIGEEYYSLVEAYELATKILNRIGC